jgi:hypothetical protein
VTNPTTKSSKVQEVLFLERLHGTLRAPQVALHVEMVVVELVVVEKHQR